MSENPNTNSDTQTPENLPFEQVLAKLENLVGRMETGRLPLEELMTDFELGCQLVKICRDKLNTLERKIEILTKDDGQAGEWADFEESVPSTTRNAPGNVPNSSPTPAPNPVPDTAPSSEDLPF